MPSYTYACECGEKTKARLTIKQYEDQNKMYPCQECGQLAPRDFSDFLSIGSTVVGTKKGNYGSKDPNAMHSASEIAANERKQARRRDKDRS